MSGIKSEQNGAPVSKTGAASLPSDEIPLLLPSGNLHGSDGHQAFSSVQKTFANIVISVVGAGVLGMPYTFKESGWLAGCLALAILGVACFYTTMLLVWSKRKLESKGHDGLQSYSDLGYVTFGNPGRLAVDVFVVLSQAAFCVGYLIFIGENLASVFTGNASDPASNSMGFDQGTSRFGSKGFIGLDWNAKAIYLWIVFPFQVWLATVRSLTRLAPFSIFADVVNVAAMVVVMSDDIVQIGHGGSRKLDAFTGWSALPYVIGVAIYGFEGFSLVLPLESSMKDRSKFGSTVAYAIAFITALYTIFAALGYVAFGESTKDIITLNMGETWHSVVIKFALCLGLFFTFPVMMHPVHDILAKRLKKGRPSILLRTMTVLVVVWTAVSVPHFGDFLSLIGSSVCCVLAFILPGLFHLRTHSGALLWWENLLDYVFILFGVGFGFWGTWSSIHNWS